MRDDHKFKCKFVYVLIIKYTNYRTNMHKGHTEPTEFLYILKKSSYDMFLTSKRFLTILTPDQALSCNKERHFILYFLET